MSASIWPRQRLFDAGLADSPTCQRCLAAPETLHHRYWKCMCNGHIPSDAIRASEHLVHDADSQSQELACFWHRAVPVASMYVHPKPCQGPGVIAR
eukprot:2592398-Alexandrium_andersonii.AAC.1